MKVRLLLLVSMLAIFSYSVYAQRPKPASPTKTHVTFNLTFTQHFKTHSDQNGYGKLLLYEHNGTFINDQRFSLDSTGAHLTFEPLAMKRAHACQIDIFGRHNHHVASSVKQRCNIFKSNNTYAITVDVAGVQEDHIQHIVLHKTGA